VNKEITLPIVNYRGEFSYRHIQPTKLEYKHSEWHGNTYHIQSYDFDKNTLREYDLIGIIRGVVVHTLKVIGENPSCSKVDGIIKSMEEL
jgi:hypothetical protein